MEKGIFGAHMEVSLLNNGPVTIILEKENEILITKEEYIKQLEAVIRKEKIKYTKEQAVDFLEENNWRRRAQRAAETINEIKKCGGEAL